MWMAPCAPYGRFMTSVAAPDALLELSFAHVAARALHVVAELGTADRLDDAPQDVYPLAAEQRLDPDALGRLLRLLEARGVFSRDTDGRWRHTEASRVLRSDHPMSLRAFARMAGTPFGWASFSGLHHSTRTGEPGICQLEPSGWLAYLQAHPDEACIFQQAMTAKAQDDIAAVLAGYDFSRHRRIADVVGWAGAPDLCRAGRPSGCLRRAVRPS